MYSVQHRAVQGPVDGKFRRDMRRVTVHDDSKLCRGLNGKLQHVLLCVSGSALIGFLLQAMMPTGVWDYHELSDDLA